MFLVTPPSSADSLLRKLIMMLDEAGIHHVVRSLSDAFLLGGRSDMESEWVQRARARRMTGRLNRSRSIRRARVPSAFQSSRRLCDR